MMKKEELLEYEIIRLVNNCNNKRRCLQLVISQNNLKKRRYGIIAGILSILSAVLMSIIATNLIPEKIIQFSSVILAAMGGVLAIYSSILHGDNSVAAIHSGSSKFLSIRERANNIALFIGFELDAAFQSYEELNQEYVNLSDIYDKYISDLPSQSELAFSGHGHITRSYSPEQMQYLRYSQESCAPPNIIRKRKGRGKK